MNRTPLICTFAVAALVGGGEPILAQALEPRAAGYGEQGLRGITRAEASATIASELVARIASLPFKIGHEFKSGETLVSFDCRRYEADLKAAVAESRTHEINVETNRQLLRHRATGANDLAMAEAKLAQSMAAVESLGVRMSQCRIVAPYDGKIVERLVDVYELPAANSPLLKIVKSGGLELDLIVPSNWIPDLRMGSRFTFRVDETGTLHDATLQSIGAVVDPVSRTIKVTASLSESGPHLRPGMSGLAFFSLVGGERH